VKAAVLKARERAPLSLAGLFPFAKPKFPKSFTTLCRHSIETAAVTRQGISASRQLQ
jgi:hypothetical protein